MSIYIMITKEDWLTISFDSLTERILTIENHFAVKFQEVKKHRAVQKAMPCQGSQT